MLTVKQASAEAGISPDTLRYYDRAGLLRGVARDGAGGRAFDGEAVRWLRCIVAMREAGMPIAEIREFASLVAEGSETARQRLAILGRCRASLSEKARKVESCTLLIDELFDVTRSDIVE